MASASASAPKVASEPPSASASAGSVLAPPPDEPVIDRPLPEEDGDEKTIPEQRRAMLERMRVMLELDASALEEVQKVFDGSTALGQGNPKVTRHPMTRKECREVRARAGIVERKSAVCKAPFMVPVFDRSRNETANDARVCVDAYEFPGIPCEYPATWATPRESALLCKAVGKRLCDAHEWEGSCAGTVKPPESDYAWGKPRKLQKNLHNKDREIVWAYGPKRDLEVCAMDSQKSDKCTASGFKHCGSNTYPAGAFPACRSPFGVYDLHGNVAEHMNLPLRAEELGSRGGKGETEMKGSWFIFKKFDAHEDDCRWRAPDWHATKLDAHNGHANYHLGFRCCSDVVRPNAADPPKAEGGG